MLCTYCGDPANTLDHVIPRAYLSVKKRSVRSGREPGETVPACIDCNNRLGSRIFPTIRHRQAFIAEELSKAVAKETPAWTSDEIEEMGPSLRSMVAAGWSKASSTQRRLAFARLTSE